MALTDQEKVAIGYHLGYPNTTMAYGLPGGFTTSGPFSFAFSNAVDNLKPSSEAFVRRCVQDLQCIEDKMTELRRDLGVKKVGNIELDIEGALGELEVQYRNWGKKLADLLGVPINPFSEHWMDVYGGNRVLEQT
jgi:hypothetical protein